MYFAAIGNIRGNLPAFNAVLREIDSRGIQTILNTGNCAAGNKWANECIDLLCNRRVISVQGEEDRRLVHFLRKKDTLLRKLPINEYEKLRQTHDILHSKNIEFLRDLPKSRLLQIEGLDIALFHGTRTSQAEKLHAGDADARFQRTREIANTQLLIFDGGPQGFWRWVDECLFVGTGFVSTPVRAAFAIIDTETTPWKVYFLSADY